MAAHLTQNEWVNEIARGEATGLSAILVVSHESHSNSKKLHMDVNTRGLLWWCSGKECFYNSLQILYRRCKRCGFNPWVGKIPWRRKWQPTPVFLAGESHRQRDLAGYSPWVTEESDMAQRLSTHTWAQEVWITGIVAVCHRAERCIWGPKVNYYTLGVGGGK